MEWQESWVWKECFGCEKDLDCENDLRWKEVLGRGDGLGGEVKKETVRERDGREKVSAKT